MTLPAGWEARTDPQSGRTYYQNNLTKATQWEPPGAPPPPPPPHAGYAGIPGNPGASTGADDLLRASKPRILELTIGLHLVFKNKHCCPRFHPQPSVSADAPSLSHLAGFAPPHASVGVFDRGMLAS